MKKQNWIWMPHAGHLIVSDDCQFHLNTYVGKYIVSTVGEYSPDRVVKEIHANVRYPKWFEKNKHLKGDYFDVAFFKKFKYIEIGLNRIYETMVFKARKSNTKCCPYEQKSGENMDFQGYSNANDAFKGHMKMCNEWSKNGY